MGFGGWVGWFFSDYRVSPNFLLCLGWVVVEMGLGCDNKRFGETLKQENINRVITMLNSGMIPPKQRYTSQVNTRVDQVERFGRGGNRNWMAITNSAARS